MQYTSKEGQRQADEKGVKRVWISKKKWKALEKRVADLERKVQSRYTLTPDLKVEIESDISSGSVAQELQEIINLPFEKK